MPGPTNVKTIIGEYLNSFPVHEKVVEVGFFGGNFTGIPPAEQEEYLKVAHQFLQKGCIDGIRLSTRPDYIDEKIIRLLKKYEVSTVELGAQSMVDSVLQKSKRGHSASDTTMASAMIKQAGMRLGLQMMIGLPGDSLEHDLLTAEKFVELQADDTRIYPALVIKGTALEQLYRQKKYKALSMNDAIAITASVYKVFESEHIRVIRIGLHPSEGLESGSDLVAGPYHKSFRELVMTSLWAEALMPLMKSKEYKKVEVYVAPDQVNYAVGYAAQNKKALLQFYDNVVFIQDQSLKNRNYDVNYR